MGVIFAGDLHNISKCVWLYLTKRRKSFHRIVASKSLKCALSCIKTAARVHYGCDFLLVTLTISIIVYDTQGQGMKVKS